MLLVSVLSVTVCWQVVSTPRADKTFSLPLVGKKKFSSAKASSGKEGHKKSNPRGAAHFLPAIFVGDGEFLTGVTATGAKDATAVGAGHSCAEAVFVHTLAAGRLECSFHDISILYFSRKDCKGSNSGGKNKIIFQYVPPACRRTRRRGARRRRARCARSRAGACDGPSRWQFPR